MAQMPGQNPQLSDAERAFMEAQTPGVEFIERSTLDPLDRHTVADDIRAAAEAARGSKLPREAERHHKETDRQRRGLAYIGANDIRAMTGLPEGYEAVSVSADWARDGILVMLRHPKLRPVPPGAEPPVLLGSWHVERLRDEHDCEWVRWVWEPDDLDIEQTVPGLQVNG